MCPFSMEQDGIQGKIKTIVMQDIVGAQNEWLERLQFPSIMVTIYEQ